MRTQKMKILFVVLLILPLSMIIGQDKNERMSFHVHEDVVKPSMVTEYESIVKEFIGHLKKHDIQDINMITTHLTDSRYLFVGPLKNMAQLDHNNFTTLVEKMGKEAVGELFDRMDKCYDIEHDYVIHLDKELTYMPEGITQTPEGKDFRKFHYLHVTPENSSKVRKNMKAIKELFEQKGSKEYYRVYKSGFGTRGAYYMVAIASKDPLDQAQMSKENDVLLGEDGNKAMQALFGNLLKYEVYEGRMRPDMAYSPK